MKKLKNVLLVLTMAVMCLVLYYVALIFIDINKLVKEDATSNTQENETTGQIVDGNTDSGDITDDSDKDETDADMENENVISIVVFGENFVHDSVIESGKQSDGTYNYDFLFNNLKAYVDEADISAIYQSTVIGGNDLGIKGYPNFNTPEEMMEAIHNAGFNVALLASNQTNDIGTTAIKKSISLWRNYSAITAVGVNADKENVSEIPVVEVKGKRIALLNYTAGMNAPIENSEDKYMVNYLTKDRVVADISKAEGLADYVIVFPYWVSDYTHATTESQKELAKAMTEAGADLIVGASSHFIGEIEQITSDNGNEALCYYSVGNFCSSFNYADAMVGGIARITLNIVEDQLILDESKTGITPIVTHYTHTAGEENAEIVGVYPLWAYTSEMAAGHGIITRGNVPFSMEIIQKIISENIEDKYLLSQ